MSDITYKKGKGRATRAEALLKKLTDKLKLGDGEMEEAKDTKGETSRKRR